MTVDAPQVGYLVKKAQAALHTSMELALRPIGVTVSQYACLHLLHEQPGISAAELARSAFVTRQSMNSLLQALLERGLVERQCRATSGRALPTKLTVAGAELLRKAEVLVDRIEMRMLSDLSKDAQSQLARALSRVVSSLEAGAPS